MTYTFACINGPNLNLQGHRKNEFYGVITLKEINKELIKRARKLKVKLIFYQSNYEGALIDFLQKEGKKLDGIIINPGPLTFYGYALRDAVVDTSVPFISVHLSNIHARAEQFRHTDIFADVAIGGIYGFKEKGYYLALEALFELLKSKTT